MIIKKLSIVLLAIICVSLSANAEVRLPQLFQSGMVMQRGKPIPVWGWADKGEQVTITFQKKTYTTTADVAALRTIEHRRDHRARLSAICQ